MRVIECAGDFSCDAHRLGNRQLLHALQIRAQRLTRHQRHHVVQQSRRLPSPGFRLPSVCVRIPRIQQRKDVRMLKLGSRVNLGEEALAAQGRAEIGVQDLDRHIAVVLEVMSEIDRGHATRAEFALDAIAITESCREAFEDTTHGSVGVTRTCTRIRG